MDLIAFIEEHLTLIASLVAVMASLGSVYMVADRRWSKLEHAVETTSTMISTQIDSVGLKLDSHADTFNEHARQEQVWMASIDNHLRVLNGKVFEHHGEIHELKGNRRDKE